MAQAEHTIRDLTDALEAHLGGGALRHPPAAGRMPCHMNVVLAEAEVAYEKLKDMDDGDWEFGVGGFRPHCRRQ